MEQKFELLTMFEPYRQGAWFTSFWCAIKVRYHTLQKRRGSKRAARVIIDGFAGMARRERFISRRPRVFQNASPCSGIVRMGRGEMPCVASLVRRFVRQRTTMGDQQQHADAESADSLFNS